MEFAVLSYLCEMALRIASLRAAEILEIYSNCLQLNSTNGKNHFNVLNIAYK